MADVAKGAALMSGTTMSHEIIASAWPQLGNRVLAEQIQKNIELIGMPQWSKEEDDFARRFQKSLNLPVVGLETKHRPLGARPQSFASNDNGDVTWVVPSAYFNFPASVPGVTYHNWRAGVTPVSFISHKGQIAGAKVLAASMLDMFTEPEVLKRAREQFALDTKGMEYFSLLPPEAKPRWS